MALLPSQRATLWSPSWSWMCWKATHARPFRRCLRCNAPIEPVAKEAVLERLPARTKECYEQFYECSGCRRVYWKGAHYAGMWALLEHIR